MLNFLLYMIFSGFEYLAIFFLIFGIFNMDLREFKWEILIGASITTLISYLLVRVNLHSVVPLPLILIPILSVILIKIFNETIIRSIVISAGGFLVYGLIQFSTGYLFVFFGFIEAADLTKTFESKTYAMQTLCALIATFITMHVKITNSGFGFMLKKEKTGRSKFLVMCLLLIATCGVISYSFYIFETVYLILLSLIVLIVSTLIFLALSKRRDDLEFV